MLIGHSLADPFGRVMAVDHNTCEILQRTQSELLGVHYRSFTHPDDHAHNAGMMARLTTLPGPVTIRKRYVRPDGSLVRVDVHVSRLVTGNVGHLVGTLQPVDPKVFAPTPQSLWRSAMDMQDRLGRRRTELGEDLFSDHGWSMLLQIYMAEAEGHIISINALSKRIDVALTIVERWAKVLVLKQLVEYCDGALQLTSLGFKRVEGLLE